MKSLKRLISILTVALIVIYAGSVTALAETNIYITFRVEGVDENIYFKNFALPYTDTLTAAQALEYLDSQTDEVKFTGLSDGYIYSVNGMSNGQFGGLDAWGYAINNVAGTENLNNIVLSNGNTVTVYYGSYNCQVPVIDASRFDKEGIISFSSYNTEYDKKNMQSGNKIVGANVTIMDKEFVTDENGEIMVPLEGLDYIMPIQIEKKDANGVPAVVRFPPYQTICFNNAELPKENTVTDTDEAAIIDTDWTSDTDIEIEAETNSDTEKTEVTDNDLLTDTDTEVNSDTDSSASSDTDSNKLSKSSSAAVTTSAQSSSKATETVSAAYVSTSVETAQLGDSSIFPAGILLLAAAAFVIITLVLVCFEK